MPGLVVVDVGVVEGCEHAGLAFEAREPHRIVRDSRRQHFYGHHASKRSIDRSPDVPHGTGAHVRDDVVVQDRCSRRQPHLVGQLVRGMFDC